MSASNVKISSMATASILSDAPRLVALAIEKGWMRKPGPSGQSVDTLIREAYYPPSRIKEAKPGPPPPKPQQSELADPEKPKIGVRMSRGDLFCKCPGCGSEVCLQPHKTGWRIPVHRDSSTKNVCMGSLNEVPVKGAR